MSNTEKLTELAGYVAEHAETIDTLISQLRKYEKKIDKYNEHREFLTHSDRETPEQNLTALNRASNALRSCYWIEDGGIDWGGDTYHAREPEQLQANFLHAGNDLANITGLMKQAIDELGQQWPDELKDHFEEAKKHLETDFDKQWEKLAKIEKKAKSAQALSKPYAQFSALCAESNKTFLPAIETILESIPTAVEGLEERIEKQDRATEEGEKTAKTDQLYIDRLNNEIKPKLRYIQAALSTMAGPEPLDNTMAKLTLNQDLAGSRMVDKVNGKAQNVKDMLTNVCEDFQRAKGAMLHITCSAVVNEWPKEKSEVLHEAVHMASQLAKQLMPIEKMAKALDALQERGQEVSQRA